MIRYSTLPPGSAGPIQSLLLILLLLLFVIACSALSPPAESAKVTHSSDDLSGKALATVVRPDDEKQLLAKVGVKKRRLTSEGDIRGGGLALGTGVQRSLEDFAPDDLVLLATVDGGLSANDRKTGVGLWELLTDEPAVSTIYHRANMTAEEKDEDIEKDDMLTWIVEPSERGDLFFFTPENGLQKLDVTIKDIVNEFSPYTANGLSRVYNGEKKTTSYALDAANGRVKRVYSTSGIVGSMKDNRCEVHSGLKLGGNFECEPSDEAGKTIMIGRTEYTIAIQDKNSGELIWTIKYNEWEPNRGDRDLISQHDTSLDSRYIYSGHDGFIFGFKDGEDDIDVVDRVKQPLYSAFLSSPAIRVFDVVKGQSNPDTDDLLVLPQPPPRKVPQFPGNSVALDNKKFWVSCTTAGGWYAMSEGRFPTVTSRAIDASCYRESSKFRALPPNERAKSLIGVHMIRGEYQDIEYRPSLPMPYGFEDRRNKSPTIDASMRTEQASANSLSHLLKDNSSSFLILVGVLVITWKFLGKSWFNSKNIDVVTLFTNTQLSMDQQQAVAAHELAKSQILEPSLGSSDVKNITLAAEVSSTIPDHLVTSASSSIAPVTAKLDEAESVEPTMSSGIKFEEDRTLEESKSKGKRKRGKRGGRAGKKAKARAANGSSEHGNVDDDEEINEIVRSASGLEDNTTKIALHGSYGSNGEESMVQSVTPLKLGSLIIFNDDDRRLGQGSHGTSVYPGNFEGRNVAVKRILNSSADIAEKEIETLKSSDFHPNIVRYFCCNRSTDFLYIALELCAGSLADVVEHPETCSAIEPYLHSMSDENTLLQMTRGLHHLHLLKIVHRDIKPQNILVGAPNFPMDSDPASKRPRILISDFGLCKKLQSDEYSFAATTAHNAGTIGWRAPELMTSAENASTIAFSGTGSGTGSGSSLGSGPHSDTTVVVDGASRRRATNKIDIFALGCVFYFVLTGGRHPFGEHWYRQGNIMSPSYAYDLSALSILPGNAKRVEATDLIESMIARDPRARPDTRKILNHPYFWSAQRRLDFLTDLSDRFEAEKEHEKQSLGTYRSPHLRHLESDPEIIFHDWQTKKVLGDAFFRELKEIKRRSYDGSRVLDLLRAIRNKSHHLEDMIPEAQQALGDVPEGFVNYFGERFPKLWLHCYVTVQACAWEGERRLKRYFEEEG